MFSADTRAALGVVAWQPDRRLPDWKQGEHKEAARFFGVASPCPFACRDFGLCNVKLLRPSLCVIRSFASFRGKSLR